VKGETKICECKGEMRKRIFKKFNLKHFSNLLVHEGSFSMNTLYELFGKDLINILIFHPRRSSEHEKKNFRVLFFILNI
jgi:hypothetical protein